MKKNLKVTHLDSSLNSRMISTTKFVDGLETNLAASFFAISPSKLPHHSDSSFSRKSKSSQRSTSSTLKDNKIKKKLIGPIKPFEIESMLKLKREQELVNVYGKENVALKPYLKKYKMEDHNVHYLSLDGLNHTIVKASTHRSNLSLISNKKRICTGPGSPRKNEKTKIKLKRSF